MKVDIIKSYPDNQNVSLGTVEVLQSHFTEQQVREEIELMWGDFQDTEPDSDCLFINYLEEKRPWLFRPADSNVVVFLS